MRKLFHPSPEKGSRLVLLAAALAWMAAVNAGGQDIKLPPEATWANGQLPIGATLANGQLPPGVVLGSTLPPANPPPFVSGQVLTTITQGGQAPGGFALPPTATTGIGGVSGNALPPGAQPLPAGVIFAVPPGALPMQVGANSAMLPVTPPAQPIVNSAVSSATTHLPAGWRPHQ